LEEKTKKFEHKDILRSVPQTYKWTYIELKAHVDAFTNGLLDMEFEPCSKILLGLHSTGENIVASIASASLGVKCINMDANYTQKSVLLAGALLFLRPKALLFSPLVAEPSVIKTLFPELSRALYGWPIENEIFPFLKHLIHTSSRRIRGTYKYKDIIVPNSKFVNIPEARSKVSSSNVAFVHPKIDLDPDPLCQAVYFSHQEVLQTANFLAKKFELTVEDRVLHTLSLNSHIGQSLLWSCIGSGSVTVIASEVFDTERILRAIQNEMCTILVVEGSHLQNLLDYPKLKNINFSTLRSLFVVNPPSDFSLDLFQQALGVKKIVSFSSEDSSISKGTQISKQNYDSF